MPPQKKHVRDARSAALPSVLRQARRIKLFLCDVDGILTDGGVYVGDNGQETKRFYIPDGLGLILLRQAGIPVGWISNRPSQVTEVRARELKIDFLSQTRLAKVAAAEDILQKTGFGWEETCYLGDDIVDLELLKKVGLAVTVPQAVAEAKKLADYVTRSPGGNGAVRETVELILKAQKKWPVLVAAYQSGGR